MNRQNPIVKGTLILTITGLITRIIGFYYRIFLSNKIGATQLGIYQMVFPLLILAFALTSSGVQLVISRQVAACSSNITPCKNANRRQVLFIGLIISLSLSLPIAFCIRTYANLLAIHFLGDERCTSLVKIAAYAIPLSSIHMCIEGYYYGQRKSFVPAIACLCEQLARMFCVWLLCKIALSEGRAITVEIAMYGLVLGEAASALISLTALSFEQPLRLSSFNLHCTTSIFYSFIKQGIPLTANRVLLNSLQSVEALLIPVKLKAFGLSHGDSLALYGILTGMAMPFIMFPSTLTNSVSTMLLPTVANAQANHKETTLSKTAEYTLSFCLLLGIFCTGVFVFFGENIGIGVFNNATAGKMLKTLGWICPLLYISNTFASMIHGLGKTNFVFCINLLSLSLRILVVIFLIPKYSILGYLWGMLLCHLLSTVLYYLTLRKHIAFTFSPIAFLVTPIAVMLILCTLGKSILSASHNTSLPFLVVILAICGCFYVSTMFFLEYRKIKKKHPLSTKESPIR